MIKPELGYYLAPAGGLGDVVVPIYGLRAIPDEIAERYPQGYGRKNWQVDLRDEISNDLVWI